VIGFLITQTMIYILLQHLPCAKNVTQLFNIFYGYAGNKMLCLFVPMNALYCQPISTFHTSNNFTTWTVPFIHIFYPIFLSSRFLLISFEYCFSACSVGYNIDMYPQFESVNSQANEQANSGIKRLKGFISYMNQRNFMRHCKLYLWLKNKAKDFQCNS